ncbi:dihydroxyacetone kinase phosphoryl donor subunit DhaM [Georgenia sp. MJ170]|uniref:dihydroxyacetone kinase phosphoryl donor subunit DhaM n=1 Tax=Georgenia sunbinii TaxID=3117728 RepID=UPI002F25F339
MTVGTAPTTAIVVVSHSQQLAAGVVELAAQMAPDVELRAAGGTDDGRVGTSFDTVMTAVSELAERAQSVVVLTDIGSATMTAEAVLEALDDPGRLALADGPLVEGAVAAAVESQIGGDLAAVHRAAQDAALFFTAARAPEVAAPAAPDPAEVIDRAVELRNHLGLHARAAAMLASVVAGFDARVEINGVDGTSTSALTALELPMGALLRLRAAGPQAEHVLDAVGRVVADRFGEE